MAILNCFMIVTASATPMSPDSLSPSVADPRQTKILLPKKKPVKWSTGMDTGDYGGPPPATKLRKYWGGEGEDPITSDEFIWNKDFMPRMERLVRDSSAPPIPIQSNRVKEVPSGFLSINRVMSLDSMDVDLSKELAGPTKRQLDMLVEPKAKPDGPPRIRWRLAPTRKEQEKWDRAAKAATGGSEAMFRELKRPKGDPQALAAQSREQYSKLKNKLQIITLGIGVVGLASAYVSYSPEITLSYGAGFAGSLVYMRMLGNTIDSMAGGAKGLIKGAIGQPRLLVPVLLVMLYNRWNGILVPEYGFLHLDLIPMLVGFFTYKVATFSLAIEEALTVTQKDPST